MTELSFLIDLLVNEKLTKSVKEKIVARVKEVEEQRPTSFQTPPRANAQVMVNGVPQSPSTAAKLAQHAAATDPAPNLDTGTNTIGPPQAPVQHIAQTPATAAAMQSRQEAILQAGKIEKGRTSPRKF